MIVFALLLLFQYPLLNYSYDSCTIIYAEYKEHLGYHDQEETYGSSFDFAFQNDTISVYIDDREIIKDDAFLVKDDHFYIYNIDGGRNNLIIEDNKLLLCLDYDSLLNMYCNFIIIENN